jgi:shikimate dehydrogenase
MKLYGLIGFPLTHSFSARYFSQKFEQEQLNNCQYQNFEIEHVDELKTILSANPDLCGLNVTIPHKSTVIPLLDELSEDARNIGAVNVISIINGKTIGYNTDAFGFKQSLNGWLPGDIKGALILGTGGASKAIVFVLKQMGISVKIVSRKSGADLTYEQIDQAILDNHQLIINCTPMGTSPETNSCPDLPYSMLTKNHYLYDLVYNPAETAFMKQGVKFGAKTKNGFQMLILQAEAAWKIWNPAN